MSRYSSVAVILLACVALVVVGIAWDDGRSFLFGGVVGLLVLAFGVTRALWRSDPQD